MNQSTLRLGIVASILSAGSLASAATFVVTSTNEVFDQTCSPAPGHCSLKDAIYAAELNPGADNVKLQTSAKYTMSTFFTPNSCTSLPNVTSTIRIIGSGATLERSTNPGTPAFGFFTVTGTGANLTIEDVTLRRAALRTQTISCPMGGVTLFNQGSVTVRDSILEENEHALMGTGGSITVERSTFRNNTGFLGSSGAAIWITSASLTVRKSAFIGNQGAVFLEGAPATLLADSTFYGNDTDWDGGAIALLSGSGGLLNVVLRNLTITENFAAHQGGGIHSQAAPGQVRIENTILANNSAPDGANYYVPSAAAQFVSGGNNTIADYVPWEANFPWPSAAGDQVFSNGKLTSSFPGLLPLHSNGTAGGDYLMPNYFSVAVSHGNSALCAPTDQLSLGRVATCEVGAIEQRDCVAPPPNLAAWYSIDSVHGLTDIADDGVPNNGTAATQPPEGPGYVAEARCFAGSSEKVTVANHQEVDVTGGTCSSGQGWENFAVDAWVRTRATGTQALLDKRASSPSLRGWQLYVYNGRPGLQMATGNGYTNFNSPTNTPAINDGKWHLVVASVERCVTGGGRLYVDGNLVHTFTARDGSISNTANLTIGTSFQGCLDEVEFFGYSLEPSDVTSLWTAGPAGKCKGPQP